LQQFASILNNSKPQIRARRKEEKIKANRFEMHDYYNSEGQHRNYERNLKSLPYAAADSTEDTADTFIPAVNATVADDAKERNGARHLSGEMKRRIEKQAKKKRERMDFEETDVSSINKRNKRFNQKISRNFDKHTAEIRQNLERGTAL
jgi:pre-mRNA-splicing factor SYF2